MSFGQQQSLRLRAEAGVTTPARSQVAFLDSYEVLRELEPRTHAVELQTADLRRAKLQREAARQRYRDLFQRASVAYLVIEPARSVDAIHAAAELLGVNGAELSGARLSRFVVADDREA